MLLRLGAFSVTFAAFGSTGWAQTPPTGAEGPMNGPGNPLAAPWAAWKAAYLDESGRVIDALQQGASHSESQGYGLYLAALFGDDAAFDAIYGWTETNLAIRSDALLAWRWLPGVTGAVPDRNNASDGDLFYAWALVTRGQRDGDAALMDRARAIANDLVAACVTESPDGSGRLVLKPAAQGFERDGGIVINPSYYMPRAMRDVARATGARALATCAADGAAIMAALAREGLVPDWVEITPDGMKIPDDREERNGYEALRVALFLIWSGESDHPAVTMQARAYRRATATRPSTSDSAPYATVFDPRNGDVIEASHHVGYSAVAALAECAASDVPGSAIPFYRTRDQAYYPATLHLMALIAQITATPECVPI
ncbi:glycosyl hydrolase family 8 [Oceaniglobus indicus]|uniref:glycosyl hydrolase family 8 n=1 Tax=Oceaniglobus indicus TaxID=2047749 RepID=UPI001F4E2033|nr:glycosyl hydrolase family 8 [Oceaniglobus indicus]